MKLLSILTAAILLSPTAQAGAPEVTGGTALKGSTPYRCEGTFKDGSLFFVNMWELVQHGPTVAVIEGGAPLFWDKATLTEDSQKMEFAGNNVILTIEKMVLGGKQKGELKISDIYPSLGGAHELECQAKGKF